MKSSYYKNCIVPQCKSTGISTPNKLFIYVPNSVKIRQKWLNLARRKDPHSLSSDSRMHFCEDHFDLPNDMANYMEYHIMGKVSQVRMKPGCTPSKFECQEDRKKRTCHSRDRPNILKKQRRMTIAECLNDSQESSPTPSSSEILHLSQHDPYSESSCYYQPQCGSESENSAAVSGVNILQVCRICLVTDFEMASMEKLNLQKKYEELLGIYPCNEDNLPQMLCRDCVQRLASWSSFKDKAMNSYSIMIDIITQQGVLTLDNLKVKLRESEPHIYTDYKKPPEPYLSPKINGESQAEDINIEVKQEEIDIDEDQVLKEVDSEINIDVKDSIYTNTPLQIKKEIKVGSEERHEMNEANSEVADGDIFIRPLDVNSFLNFNLKQELINWNPNKEKKEVYVKTKQKTELFNNNLKSSELNEQPNTSNTFTEDASKNQNDLKNLFVRKKLITGRVLYVCNYCNEQSKNRSNIIKHIASHRELKQFACHICSNRYQRKDALTTHLKTHSEDFSCSYCSYKGTCQRFLRRHLKIHTEVKQFACDMCDFRTNEKESLVTHISTHTWKKRFLCSECDFKCRHHSLLVKHKRIHTGRKPFACNYCEYRCNDTNSLRRHIRFHTGETPFVCSECYRKFKSKHGLSAHVKRTHKSLKTFECQMCNEKFSQEYALCRHRCKVFP